MNKIFTIKFLQIAVFIFAANCFFNSPIFAQKNQSEKIKSVRTVTGKFIRFVVGDYIHPEIRKSNGKIESYWLDSYDLQYFLVVNHSKTMTFTYEVVDIYIPEGSGRMIIKRIKSAKIGNLTFEKWWKGLRKKYTVEQIKKKYDALVEKHTKY